MQNKLISILIPVFNKATFINRCFESVSKQTYKNLECIFIDDGSNDNSFELLSKLIEAYNGSTIFKIVKHNKNCGVSVARNTGIKNACGEYFYFLDADDEITINCIEILVDLAQKYSDADFIQGNAYQLPRIENDYYDISAENFPEYINDSKWIRHHYYVKPRILINITNKLFKTKFVIENNLYFKPNIVHEDDLWSFFAAKKLNSIAFTKEYCYIRYYVPDSIMTAKNRYNSINSKLIVTQEMLKNIEVEIGGEQLNEIFENLLMLEIDKNAEYYNKLSIMRKELMCSIIKFNKKNIKFWIKFTMKKIFGQKIIKLKRKFF